jgi:hypothetical protein
VEEEKRWIDRKTKQVYVGVINKAKQDFLKNKDKKQRSENKGGIRCQQKKKRRFSFFALQKTSRIDSQGAYYQKEEERSEENIAWRFGEIPEGEKTC